MQAIPLMTSKGERPNRLHPMSGKGANSLRPSLAPPRKDENWREPVSLGPPHARDTIFGELAAGIKDQRALIGFNCFGSITGFFVGQSKSRPCISVLIVNVKCGIEVFDRLVVLTNS